MAATNPTSALGVQNWYADTLSQACGASDTTINVNNVPSPSEGYLIIDPNNISTREVIHYTSKGSGTVILPGTGDRGVDGTTAQAHAQGTAIVMNYTSSHYTALQNAYAIPSNAIQANQLATTAICLGYAQSTADFSTASGSYVDITNVAVTVTIPAGGRRVKITSYAGACSTSVASNAAGINVYDVTAGAQLSEAHNDSNASTDAFSVVAIAVHTPTAGSRTYKAQFARGTNAATAHTNGSATVPVFILVEMI